MQAIGVPGSCVCSDDQPLPFVAGDAGGESLEGNGMAAKRVYATDQCEAQALGARLWRTLQVGCRGARPLFLGADGLHTSQSGEGGNGEGV